MYKVTTKNLHEAYLKGYVDGIQGRENLADGKAVVDYLMNAESLESLEDINATGVYGAETDLVYAEWMTEVINKEIEDFYNEDTEERLIVPKDPFGEHFSINQSSAKEKL
jgi:hypothetical protein